MAEKIPLVDLKEQYRSLAGELEPAVREVLESGIYVGGPQVDGFEREFAAFSGGACCVGVSNGTEALRLALLAYGIGTGREVILPAFTFIATAEVVSQIGAVPVFADVCEDSLCIDPDDVRKKITPKTAAIIPVHLFGHAADMEPIADMAAERDIRVIQDACQAHGTLYRDKRLGELGDAACFSFYPSKSLGSCGEGGAVVTGDEKIAARIGMLRDHGQKGWYVHEMEGYNARLHALQAAILRVKLRRLEGWIDLRREAAARYDRRLGKLPVRIPGSRPDVGHSYSLYVIRSPHRDQLRDHLGRDGIGTGVHYPSPLHLLKPYQNLGFGAGDLPVSEAAARTVLSLPMYPEISAASQERIARCIDTALARCG
jgi:dTDP-4-amino-4,6-dideoxygalactose transaminase